VVLIAGGKDKGLNLMRLRPVAQKVRQAVLIGEMSARIAQSWSPSVRCERAGSLADASGSHARRRTPGMSCFFHGHLFVRHVQKLRRPGDQFRQLIQSLRAMKYLNYSKNRRNSKSRRAPFQA